MGLYFGKVVVMIHTKGMERLSVDRIYGFLEKVDKTFPIALSEKTDLHQFALKLYNNATLCTVEEDNQIVAMVAGYTENTINSVAYISMVATLPGYKGKGYARQLVSEFIERAKSKRLKAVHLYTVRNNTAAVALYNSLGFVEWHLENEKRPEDIHLIYYLKHKTALVTAIGSYAADIVIKNLKTLGFKVIGTDIYAREWIADAYNVSEFYQVPRVADKEEFFKAIDYICNEENITHIIPSTDIEVDFFNEYRNYFEEKNITICISSKETLRICRNKKTQQEFIDQHVPSVNAIPTLRVEKDMDAPFDYPMVCKPFDGRSSQGLRYVYTEEDWEAVKTCAGSEKYIVQPKIKGRIVTVDVVRQKDGKAIVAIPRVELLRTLNGAGLSVKVYPDKTLEAMCKELADAFNIIGCVNFEFIKDEEEKYHYVECNPRFSGGVEFSCIAGYDCIGNHIRCFENVNIDQFSVKRETFIARKFEEYVTRVK